MSYTKKPFEELPELPYEDGLRFLYFNTKGTKGGNEAIRNLLTYIQNSKGNSAIDAVTQELHEYVSRVKVRPDVREEYMKFDEIIAYERRDAAEEAVEETAEENVRNLFINGASVELVVASITKLSKERIRQIYDEVKKDIKLQ